MNASVDDSPIPEPALEIPDAVGSEEEAHYRLVRRASSVKKRRSAARRWFAGVAGWLWRWLFGAALCTNYFLSVIVAGWMCRWVQGHVLRNWWKKSPQAARGSFAEFCADLEPDAPVGRPRWILRERIRSGLRQRNEKEVGFWRRLGYRLSIPWHSLYRNIKMGVVFLFCTYVFTGWGCALMVFGWEYGWLNSFHKGYELSAIGPVVSLVGVALFIVSLAYVLMAQVHFSVTGEAKSFFDFRFVWRLIQARPLAYLGLVFLLTLVSLPLEAAKIAVFIPPFFGNNEALSDPEVLVYFQRYVFGVCLIFFVMLLQVRRVAANVYSTSVLAVLRKGWIDRSDLHPTLQHWLDRLELHPHVATRSSGIVLGVRRSAGWSYRKFMYVLILLTGFVFVAKRYVGEFFVYHPLTGFANHELVQIPSFDVIPQALKKAGNH